MVHFNGKLVDLHIFWAPLFWDIPISWIETIHPGKFNMDVEKSFDVFWKKRYSLLNLAIVGTYSSNFRGKGIVWIISVVVSMCDVLIGAPGSGWFLKLQFLHDWKNPWVSHILETLSQAEPSHLWLWQWQYNRGPIIMRDKRIKN